LRPVWTTQQIPGQATGLHSKTLSPKRKEKKKRYQVWWYTPVTSATQEAEIRRILIGRHPRQKISETPYLNKQAGHVVHAYNPAAQEA
jgi:hypothetical protein